VGSNSTTGRAPPNVVASAIALALVSIGCTPATRARVERAREVSRDIDSARELDRQGVRSFREGHFADAARYFRAAHDRGGPSSELWNVARCEEHVDDPQAAVAALEEYLALADLSATDRVDARREADALRQRPSPLTVTTRPPGAAVWIDGTRAANATPVSLAVAPGAHSISIRRAGYAEVSRAFEARLGQAVIVSLDLLPGGK
jgi:hypothetical protein